MKKSDLYKLKKPSYTNEIFLLSRRKKTLENYICFICTGRFFFVGMKWSARGIEPKEINQKSNRTVQKDVKRFGGFRKILYFCNNN